MTFDKQEHKDVVLQLLANATFPGHLLDLVVEVRDAVQSASVARIVTVDGAPAAPKKRR